MTAPARGSDKVLEQLFGQSTVTQEQLAAAVNQATLAGLLLKRLWWKGQPQIDLIRAEANIAPGEVSGAVERLFRLHTDANQITLEAFPIGLPAIEAVHLNITVNRNPSR